MNFKYILFFTLLGMVHTNVVPSSLESANVVGVLLEDESLYVEDSRGKHLVQACNKNKLLRSMDTRALFAFLASGIGRLRIDINSGEYIVKAYTRGLGGLGAVATVATRHALDGTARTTMNAIMEDAGDLIVESDRDIHAEVERTVNALMANERTRGWLEYLNNTTRPWALRVRRRVCRTIVKSVVGGISFATLLAKIYFLTARDTVRGGVDLVRLHPREGESRTNFVLTKAKNLFTYGIGFALGGPGGAFVAWEIRSAFGGLIFDANNYIARVEDAFIVNP